MRVLLLLVLLVVTWSKTEAACDSTEIVDGRNRCIVTCGYGDRVCECAVGFEECELTLITAEIKTSASYLVVGERPSQVLRPGSNIYNLDSVTGEAFSITNGTCQDYTDTSQFNCIEPNWVDGKNFKLVLTLNGVIPSPTIIVDEGATIIAHIQNTYFSQATSIHWHGLEQFNTPWMDGVGGITQCQVQPGTTFTHAFIADVPGTFWYHSHTGSQRADGLAGALVIRENETTREQASAAFANFGIGPYLDFPDRHTLVLGDWFEGTGDNDIFDLQLGFYPNISLEQIPTRNDQRYRSTNSYDGGGTGSLPFYSSLINGRGREESVPYPASRLSEFTVQQGNLYRFRLIGAVSLFAQRFSIDGHNLTTIATDAYFIQPIEEVQSIIVHSGERYDFLLNATADISNYIIRIETLEAVPVCLGNAPFASLNNYAEAILHYETAPGDNGIPSTLYQNISQSSPRRDCTSGPKCNAVNCPFENFSPSYGVECINVDRFRLLINTSAEELPEAYPSDDNHLFFLNLNFEGEGSSPSINGRNFVLPPYPPQTNRDLYNEYANICNNNQDCSDTTNSAKCICTHRIVLEYNKTVQLVVSALGRFLNAHPMHVHGHTFQVLKIGYPTYNDNGFVRQQNLDIQCDTDHTINATDQCPVRNFTCTNPSWSGGVSPLLSISPNTPRKDTVIIPAGGYVVLNFISDNPGVWFAHCHIEPHQILGMVIFIDEAIEQQNPPFEELINCQNYIFNSTQFYNKLQFDPNAVLGSNAVMNKLSIFSLMASLLAFICFF